jgi:Kef-type K+ transport system membrane component KefB
VTDIGTLALIVACGLAGPLLAGATGSAVPVVVGEILAGVVIGTTGFGIVDASDPTLELLASLGFATLMFTVGMSVPLRDHRLRRSLGRGALAAGIGAVAAVPAALATAALASTGHAALYAVILASSSAAVAVPILADHGLIGGPGLTLVAQITIADIAAVIAVPFALQPGRVWHVILGSIAVVVATLGFFATLHLLMRVEWYRRLRAQSRERGWALDLRIALAALITLAWLATETGTSVLLAGFGAGLIVAWVGGPERLGFQVRGVGQGFLIPVFFVLLGARLNVRALATDPGNLVLAASLVALNVGVHCLAAVASRQRLPTGLVSAAQLGVPAAVVALGLTEDVIDAGQGAAIVVAALLSVGVCATGAALLAGPRRAPAR